MAGSLQFEAPSALGYFASLVADDASLPLLEAAVSIGQDEYPDLDIQSVLAEIDTLAERLRRRIPADAVPLQRLRWLNRFFFHDPLLWTRTHAPPPSLPDATARRDPSAAAEIPPVPAPNVVVGPQVRPASCEIRARTTFVPALALQATTTWRPDAATTGVARNRLRSSRPTTCRVHVAP